LMSLLGANDMATIADNAKRDRMYFMRLSFNSQTVIRQQLKNVHFHKRVFSEFRYTFIENMN
jgi:hypothetical protein